MGSFKNFYITNTLILLSIFVSNNGYPQSLMLQLTDSQGNVLDYGHIENTRLQWYRISGVDGSVRLDTSFCSVGDSLKISYLGFQTQYYRFPGWITDTLRVVLTPSVQLLPEAVVEQYVKSASYRLKSNQGMNAGMPFHSGKIVAFKLRLQEKIQLSSIKLAGIDGLRECDSLLIRISILDTLDFDLHHQRAVGKSFAVRRRQIKLDELSLYSKSADSTYYLVMEFVLPEDCSSIQIQGGAPDPGKGIPGNVFIYGDDKDGVQRRRRGWYDFPYWIPKLEMTYLYR